MTAPIFTRMTIAFKVVNEDDNRLLLLDPEKGLACTTDKTKEAKVSDVASYVLKQLDTLQLPEDLNENFVSKLRPHAMDYFQGQLEDETLVHLLAATFFSVAMRIKQLRKEQTSLFVERVASCAVAFAEVEFDPLNRFLALDPDSGPFATKLKDLEADAEEVADYVYALLSGFKSADMRLSSHNGIYELQKSAIPYFERRLPKTSAKLQEICYYLFPIAEERWGFFRSRAKVVDYPKNLEHESLLENPPEVPQKEHFKQLSFGRDTLFLLQKIHYFTRRYATLQEAIGERICFHFSQNVEVVFNGHFFSYTANDLKEKEQELHRTVMGGCRAMAKGGAADSRVDFCLRALLEYKKEPLHSPEVYARLLSFLELNEFHYLSVELEKGWRPLEFSGKAVSNDMKRRFHYYSYAARKELEFLIYAHRGFTKYLSQIAVCALQEQAESVVTFSRNYLAMLDATDIEPRADLYKAIDLSLAQLFKNLPKKQYAGLFTRFSCMRFRTLHYRRSNPNFEEYSWEKYDYEDYITTLQAIDALRRGIFLSLPEALEKAGQKKPTSEERGFGVAIPVRKVVVLKKKRKKPPTPASSPSPPPPDSVTSGSPGPVLLMPAPKPPTKIDAVATKMARLTLVSSPTVISTGLHYDPRVTRWFESDADDWVTIEHNVARIIDIFYKVAVIDLPRVEHDYAERRQLAMSVTRKGKKRIGLITWAKGNKDGIIYHRWFVKEVQGKSEHFDEKYVQEAYQILKTTPMPPPFVGKPKEIAKGGSFIEYQEGRLVVAYDPQTNVRACVILPA